MKTPGPPPAPPPWTDTGTLETPPDPWTSWQSQGGHLGWEHWLRVFVAWEAVVCALLFFWVILTWL
ncbi:hypothetical protein LCGC14_0313250 [marine sediment metagenome]|uniref:Uncharacterized protein n=1 Tax=marine sediment metagenome TaxID=412755 RepID=A0A0F9WTA4_9ZZZZ